MGARGRVMSILVLSGPGGPFLDVAGFNRKARARFARWSMYVAGGLVMTGLATIALTGAQSAPAPVATPAPQTAPPPQWAEVHHPLRFYSLQSPDFGREPRVYQARGVQPGGGRQDILLFGPANPGEQPVLRVSVYRKGTERDSEARFYVEMARQAALSGLSIVRSAQPGDMPTRFGVFETADVTMASPAGDAACLGYKLDLTNPGLRISGFACGTPSRPMDRRTLACALDRLDLVSVGADRAAGRFFAGAEQNRGAGCGSARSAGWLDSGPVKPDLRPTKAGQALARK